MLRLSLVHEAPEPQEGLHYAIDGEMTIGSAEGCGLRLVDPRVSPRHARIVVEGGEVIIQDLGSPHGTIVNGLRVAQQALQPGDLLVFGKARLRVAGSSGEVGNEGSTLTRPAVELLPPSLEGIGRRAFFDALGIGDETLLALGGPDGAALVARTRHFAVLHEVSRSLRGAHSPPEMLGRLLELVLEVTGANRGFVVLTEGEPSDDEDEDTLPPGVEPTSSPSGMRVAAVRTHGPAPEAPPRLSQTVARHVLRERQAVLSSDAGDDTRFADSRSLFLSRTRALMAVPILLREEVLGALVVESEKEAFSESDLELLTVISSTAGQTLDNLRLAERREGMIAALEASRARLLETRAQLVRAEQMAVIGRLASGLAHEVKNHLSPFALADTIARRYPEDEDIQSAVEMMLEARQHILDLVNEVKGFARGAEGGNVRREPLDLLQLARAVARFASCDDGVRRHRLEVEASDEPWVQVEGARIRQVLINLVKNAADALGPGAVGTITVRVREVGNEAFVEVVDDGPGVPPSIQDRIFEPFFSTKGEQGLGLGLDISRRIARDHGGDLELESGPQGTCFRLRLPALPI
ncbi:MAG: ATP-binding protein [Myxococcota bacterium]